MRAGRRRMFPTMTGGADSDIDGSSADRTIAVRLKNMAETAHLRRLRSMQQAQVSQSLSSRLTSTAAACWIPGNVNLSSEGSRRRKFASAVVHVVRLYWPSEHQSVDRIDGGIDGSDRRSLANSLISAALYSSTLEGGPTLRIAPLMS